MEKQGDKMHQVQTWVYHAQSVDVEQIFFKNFSRLYMQTHAPKDVTCCKAKSQRHLGTMTACQQLL